jgi:hypothetical protein
MSQNYNKEDIEAKYSNINLDLDFNSSSSESQNQDRAARRPGEDDMDRIDRNVKRKTFRCEMKCLTSASLPWDHPAHTHLVALADMTVHLWALARDETALPYLSDSQRASLLCLLGRDED